MDDKRMYTGLPIFAEWSYKGFQCRIIDGEPGDCYKTAAFVVSAKGTLLRVPFARYQIEKPLIELWIDAGCPLEKTYYKAYELEKMKAAREGTSLLGIASFEFHQNRNNLEVKFKDGTTFRYLNVPYEIYTGLLKEKPLEEYFYNAIHHDYRREKVDPEGTPKKSTNPACEVDFDYSADTYDTHDLDFGRWIDLGGGERTWDSYTDDD
jgi:hypothetical protein